MRKTFRYRIYPSASQQQVLSDWLFACSLVYNRCLEDRITARNAGLKGLTAYDQQKSIAQWAKEDERIGKVYAQVRNEVAVRLHKSFDGFFRRVKSGDKPGFPKFQPARTYDSLTYTQAGFALRGEKLELGKIGAIPVRLHRPILGTIKTLTIRRMPSGWYACFSVEYNAEPLPVTAAEVGIDVGLEHFVTTSDGEHYVNGRVLRATEKALKKAQRCVARRKKGSKRRLKAVKLLAKMHETVSCRRRDYSHKVARDLVNRYGTVAAEELKIKNMVKNKHLSKSIHDAAWGQFLNVLDGKATETGREFVKVPAAYTSQTCSQCGAVAKKKLSERWHKCPCGASLQRDVNAAKNILQRARTTSTGAAASRFAEQGVPATPAQ